MPATAAPPKLSAEQARAIADAENKVAKLKADLEQAEKKRKEVRERYRDRITEPSDAPEDADKDVVIAEAGGWIIRVTSFMGGESFSLKKYLAAGHAITNAMRDAMSEPKPQERWTVKNVKGPPKPGAVELA